MRLYRTLSGFTAGRAALLACLGAVTPLAAAAGPPAACPPAGTRVVHSIGAPTEYHGVHPLIADLCLIGHGNDEAAYYYYGTWRADWPGAGSAYPALKTAITGPAGTKQSFITRSVPGWQWLDTITNEGVEPVTVGGQVFQTLKIAHERTGIEGNTYHSVITSWRDVATGQQLKVVEHQISGQSYGPATTWTAVRLEAIE